MADHGGPVIDTRGGDTNSSNHILMGISSFGNGCGTQDLPYVFTRTRKFYTWMRLEICRLTVSPPLHCFTNVPSVSPSESPSSRPTSTLEQGYFVLLSDVGKGAGSVRCGGVLIHSDV
jgi:secreted trypsin-like serine protease